MAKLHFQHHYSSLQSHMILQKWSADLVLKKHFLLLPLLNCCVALYFCDLKKNLYCLMNRKLKRSAFEIEIFCNVINTFMITFNEWINASLHNKCIIFFLSKTKKGSYWPQTFSVLHKDLVHISRQNKPVKNNLTPEMCDYCCINYTDFYLQSVKSQRTLQIYFLSRRWLWWYRIKWPGLCIALCVCLCSVSLLTCAS